MRHALVEVMCHEIEDVPFPGFAPVQVIACTLSRRIISASESPSSRGAHQRRRWVIIILAAAVEVTDVAIGRVDQGSLALKWR